MIVAGRRGGGERAGLAVQLRRGAARLVAPLARGGRAEADLVGAAAVPEAGHGDALVALAERGGPLHVEIGIA